MPGRFSGTEAMINVQQRILTIIGVWPHQPNNFRFVGALAIILAFLGSGQVVLVRNARNTTRVVEILEESMTCYVALMNIITMRIQARRLRRLIDIVRRDITEATRHSDHERASSFIYTVYTVKFIKFQLLILAFTAVAYFFKPLTESLLVNGWQKFEYDLPFRSFAVFNIDDLATYVIFYISMVPVSIITTIAYISIDCIIIIIVFHLCGNLSMFSTQIKKSFHVQMPERDYKLTFGNVIKRHQELIRMTKMTNHAFRWLLLAQLLTRTALVCFLAYFVLANAEDGFQPDVIVFFAFSLTVITVIYIYSFIGECLIDESTAAHNALEQLEWYAMLTSHRKCLIICSMRLQHPFKLTAGKFYEFSLEGFVRILKTTFGYLSVLRKVV